MLALPLTLALSLSAADVAVVERSTLGLPPSQGAQLRARLVLTFEAVKLTGELLPDACADRACLQALARARKQVVVGMTVVKSKKGLTVDLDAVDGEAVVLQQTFLLSSGDKLEKSPEAQVFVHQLAARLVKDAPVAEPEEKKPEEKKPDVKNPEVTVEPQWVERSPSTPSAAPKVLGVASAGVGVAGVVLLIAGAVVKGQLDTALSETPVVTTLTRSEAQARADAANGLMAGGTIALGLGVSGAITALVLGSSSAPLPELTDE